MSLKAEKDAYSDDVIGFSLGIYENEKRRRKKNQTNKKGATGE